MKKFTQKTPSDLELLIMETTLEEWQKKNENSIYLDVQLQFSAHFVLDKLNDPETQSKLRVLLGKHLYMISDEIEALGLSDNIRLFGIRLGEEVI